MKLYKCPFAIERIEFLAYEVEHCKVCLDNANTDTIKKLNKPKNVKELQRVLSTVNVNHKFIPNYAKLRISLNAFLVKDVAWQQSLENFKSALICKSVLK